MSLDKRLEGITQVSNITDKFVLENATPEELNKVYTKECKVYREETFDLTSNTLSDAIASLQSAITLAETKRESAEFDCNYGGDLVVRYEEVIEVPIAPKEYLRQEWRSQLKAHLEKEKDYKKYLELKEKFE